MASPHQDSETGCCPKFDPAPWDEKEITWDGKLFVKDRVRSFLHIPLNFGRVMVRNMERIEAAEALAPESVVLSDENSLWGADVYIAVSKDVPGAEMQTVSGTFLSKVFEGPYSHCRKWMEEAKSYVRSTGKSVKKIYVFYTTCPRCAKHYGKNYVVVLTQV
ncbi:MAG: hypothetical protein A2V70_13355 [Planctomycetes bacterium RBG_13_63_9]|nr:MAG: hypothetical protein A2V70_13355 [Planctomycetes bacterium RBG_13_63_9]